MSASASMNKGLRNQVSSAQKHLPEDAQRMLSKMLTEENAVKAANSKPKSKVTISDQKDEQMEFSDAPTKSKSKSKPGKNKSKTSTKKTKTNVTTHDPYYVNATSSEKEIINELVKADLDAILERDAVARIPLENTESKPETKKKQAKKNTVPNKNVEKTVVKTDWTYRKRDDSKVGQVKVKKSTQQPQPTGIVKSRKQIASKTLSAPKSKSTPKAFSKEANKEKIQEKGQRVKNI